MNIDINIMSNDNHNPYIYLYTIKTKETVQCGKQHSHSRNYLGKLLLSSSGKCILG